MFVNNGMYKCNEFEQFKFNKFKFNKFKFNKFKFNKFKYVKVFLRPLWKRFWTKVPS